MNFLPAVLMFCVILTIFASTFFTRSYEVTLLNMLSSQYIAQKEETLARAMRQKAHRSLREKGHGIKTRPSSLHYRLNLSSLRQDATHHELPGDEEKTKCVTTILLNLLEVLYNNRHASPTMLSARERDFETLIKAIFHEGHAKDNGTPFLDKTTAIANVDLKNSVLQELLFTILSGGDPANNGGQVSLPSLYGYIEIPERTKDSYILALWNAPKELLYAVFRDGATAEQFCQKTEEIFRKIRNDKTNRLLCVQECTKELKKEYGPKLLPGIFETLIEFRVTGTEPKHLAKMPGKD